MFMFPSLQNVKEPLISDFLLRVPSTFVEAYDRILNDFINNLSTTRGGVSALDKEPTFEEHILRNRRRMLPYVSRYHREAGTLTKGVDEAIKALEESSTRILVSTHQPNLFAYSGIFKKILLLETLKDLLQDSDYGLDSLRVINLFIVIDHDFADENWLRVAQLPNIRSSDGIMELRLPINKTRRWQMVCNVPLPDRMILAQWRRQLFSWIKGSSLYQPAIKNRQNLSAEYFNGQENIESTLMSNLEIFWNLVEEAYSRANTYSDFNAFLLSKIVNGLWGYKTLFIRLTDLSHVFVRGYGNLLRNHGSYCETLQETERVFMKLGIPSGVSSSSYLYSPLWLHCNCGSKCATKISNRQFRDNRIELELEGICMGCRKHRGVELLVDENEEILSQNSESEIVNELSPRSIPIVLLLSSELGVSCYASGTDGMRYIVFGNRLFEQFSPKNIPTFVVWPAGDNYYGFAQLEALGSLQLESREGIGDYMKTLMEKEEYYRSLIAPVLHERNQRVKQRQSVEDDVLSYLFSLKKQQRDIRSQYKLAKKVEKALKLRPCIIDYAVNFRLQDTELQWRQNLLYNTNLTSTAILSSKINYRAMNGD